MTTRTWHKGPPPFPGWWCCTNQLDENGNGTSLRYWRFHDGKEWSGFAAEERHSSREAAELAKISSSDPDALRWTDYWPENARVPRIDPRVLYQNLCHIRERIVLEYKAIILLQEAGRLGFNLTIERHPLHPLAMGNTQAVVNVWPKRVTS